MTLPLALEDVTPRLSLREYQREAIAATYQYLRDHDGNPVVVLPTGAGKSLVMAELVRDAVTNWPETRILILAHVKELLEQNAKELRQHFPGVDLGIYSAGLRSRDTRNQILVASIQSVYRKAFDLGRFDLILVDECHLIPHTADGMYRTFLTNSTLVNPALRVIGLTATDYRLDSGRLTTGEGALFHAVAYDANVGDLIRAGFLCRVTTRRTDTQLDTSSVHTRGGEFIPGELAAAVDVDAITRAAVAEMIRHGEDRRAWLVFCSGVEHAHHVAAELRSNGIPAATITGDTPNAERDATIAAFRAGRLRALTNCNVLTTGFNVPHVDLIALLRPTQSTGLYVQMVGRGLRNADGKPNCLVLDFAANIERHGPIDAISVRDKRASDGDGEAPVKACPECGLYLLIAARECPECGFVFPEPEPKIEPKASKAAILSDEVIEPEWTEVLWCDYLPHNKPGKPTSLRVLYQTGISRVSEWVCLEHSGYAQEKAAHWWRVRSGGAVPTTVQEALERREELREPTHILLTKEGKYDRVAAYRFPVDTGAAPGHERDDLGAPADGGSEGPQGEDLERIFRPQTHLGSAHHHDFPVESDCPF